MSLNKSDKKWNKPDNLRMKRVAYKQFNDMFDTDNQNMIRGFFPDVEINFRSYFGNVPPRHPYFTTFIDLPEYNIAIKIVLIAIKKTEKREDEDEDDEDDEDEDGYESIIYLPNTLNEEPENLQEYLEDFSVEDVRDDEKFCVEISDNSTVAVEFNEEDDNYLFTETQIYERLINKITSITNMEVSLPTGKRGDLVEEDI